MTMAIEAQHVSWRIKPPAVAPAIAPATMLAVAASNPATRNRFQAVPPTD